MTQSPSIDKLTEVGIDSHQNSVIIDGVGQQSAVARIRPQFQRLDYIVALQPQPFSQTPPGAAIDEELHASATDTAASESLAITAWA